MVGLVCTRERPRSRLLVNINAALAAELAILTEALEDAGTDVAHSLLHVAADARTAVASYLGLMVIIARVDPPTAFTAFEDNVEDGDIRTPSWSSRRQSGTTALFLAYR